MTSPVIDEDIMVRALAPPDRTDIELTLQRLRTAALLLMVDGHDRKTTRQSYQEICGAAISLCDTCARLEMARNVKAAFDKYGSITESALEEVIAGITGRLERDAADALTVAKVLKQCPMDDDKVH